MSRARDIADSASTINALDNVTASGAELNILDGVTSTTAELNILDGVTSTAAELNILDGVTSTATEINKLDALSRGSLIYGNASAETAILTKGTANQVLTSDGTDIAWANAAAGGTSGMQVLSTVTASNSATVDLETTFDSTYDDYIIMISDYVPAVDQTDLYMQYKISGSYQSASSSYYTVYVYNTSSSSSVSTENTGGTTSYIMVARYLGNAYNEVGQFKITLSNVHDTGRTTPAYCYGSCKNGGGESQGGFSHGIDASGGAVTGVRFKSSTGNITSGNFRLYGVAKS